ncbi:unnamed protein product (macronuclear) [Paramecium tetraurelia]|uniref:Transmembrane protein n=1 Tax=Paramecium tetraurelia TaxID=5888 RepID=A0CVT7_PARTE|nr:uncharacterized protein GSPATT00001106001 [Paramecium tetraurelia]CAK74904.1 unnamed protein product [Paramecium tetraurelia]|eukprot:XP_001442301.1 hypothetical protein (macronuclear) [Paramecium tetraurelia strain d4-2]
MCRWKESSELYKIFQQIYQNQEFLNKIQSSYIKVFLGNILICQYQLTLQSMIEIYMKSNINIFIIRKQQIFHLLEYYSFIWQGLSPIIQQEELMAWAQLLHCLIIILRQILTIGYQQITFKNNLHTKTAQNIHPQWVFRVLYQSSSLKISLLFFFFQALVKFDIHFQFPQVQIVITHNPKLCKVFKNPVLYHIFDSPINLSIRSNPSSFSYTVQENIINLLYQINLH